MKKIEQMWNKLCERQKELKKDLESRMKWVETMNTNLEFEINDPLTMHILAQKSVVDAILQEYQFLYFDELEVIIGNCMEFKVK